MANNFTVRWRDEVVGELQDALSDMWYLEGTWLAASNQAAQEFVRLTQGFDARQVMADPQKGTRVMLREQDLPEEQWSDALVISLADNKLLVRCVFDKDAITWLKTNVD